MVDLIKHVTAIFYAVGAREGFLPVWSRVSPRYFKSAEVLVHGSSSSGGEFENTGPKLVRVFGGCLGMERR